MSLAEATKLDEYSVCGVAGGVGTRVEDTRFDEYFGCGVGRGHSGRYRIAHREYLYGRGWERRVVCRED